MLNISVLLLLSDEGHGALAEVGGANLQDDLGANPPSFAEVSRELQLACPNMRVLTPTDFMVFVS